MKFYVETVDDWKPEKVIEEYPCLADEFEKAVNEVMNENAE